MSAQSYRIGRRTRDGERGTALIFALVVVFILSVGTSVLWRQLHMNLEEQRRAWHREQAFQLAEAGLDRAIAQLRARGAAYTGESGVPLGAGHYSVSVSAGDSPGAYVIESTSRLEFATAGMDRAGLRGRVRLAPDGSVLTYTWTPIRGKAE